MDAPRVTYEVAHLQAVEPDELPRDAGVDVFVHEELDGMGFNTVTLSAPDRDVLIEYVREQFGDEDAEWFQEYVVDRVTEHDASRDVSA
jgi:hypothetical protein